MRKKFAEILYQKMMIDKDIFFVTADLGYGIFDKIKSDFPDRFINTGAAEQVACGICVGLALSGKVPFFYSITPFGLWRPAEIIRNYINHESIPVKLVMSGRDKDYAHDGFSHDASDDERLMSCFDNIYCNWPGNENEIPAILDRMISDNKPWYLNLRR